MTEPNESLEYVTVRLPRKLWIAIIDGWSKRCNESENPSSASDLLDRLIRMSTIAKSWYVNTPMKRLLWWAYEGYLTDLFRKDT